MSEPLLGVLREAARDVPVLSRTQVLVVGGGAAGLAAACAAARSGAATLLVERNGFLGGTLTAVTLGGLCGMYRELDGELRPVVGGLWDEIANRMRACDALGAARKSTIVRGVHGIPYDPERLKLVADEMLAAFGVEVLTNATFAGVVRHDRRISAVWIETLAGRRAIVADVVIDASGDAMIAAQAGVSVSDFRAGPLQSPSAMFRMAPVDRDAFATIDRRALTALLNAAVDAGAALPRTTIAAFPYLADAEMHLNATRVTHSNGSPFDPLDPWQRSAAEREGRRQVFVYEQTLRQYVPGFARARVTDIGAVLGIRESRQLCGETELTETAVMSCTKPNDRIACCAWPIEDHTGARETVWRPLPAGDWYGIPFGCLVPRQLDNMLVAGRALSATHGAQASARISAACIAMGEAAGTAAAIALQQGGQVRVPIAEIQRVLRDRGAILDPR